MAEAEKETHSLERPSAAAYRPSIAPEQRAGFSSAPVDEPSANEAAKAPRADEESRVRGRTFWMGATVLLLVAAQGVLDSTSIPKLEEIRATGIGKEVIAGKLLKLAGDGDADLRARDFTVEMKQGTRSSRVLLWDFAAEDGDVVDVKVNGVVQRRINLLHQPAAVEVPVPSSVEVVGIKDGVGGITYGIKFPGAVLNAAYFNVAPEGSANTYTVGEP